jgi:hypothetical protein
VNAGGDWEATLPTTVQPPLSNRSTWNRSLSESAAVQPISTPPAELRATLVMLGGRG